MRPKTGLDVAASSVLVGQSAGHRRGEEVHCAINHIDEQSCVVTLAELKAILEPAGDHDHMHDSH